jgi:hypothetical protein
VLNMACIDHALLLSRQLDARLSRGETVGLWLHLRVCNGCSRWKRHLAQLRLILGEIDAQDAHTVSMPATSRARIASVLRSARFDA